MKKSLLFVVVLLSLNTYSMCRWSGVSVFPKSNQLTANSWIIIQGYASSQKTIDSLNIKYPVYLKSGQHIVPLKLVTKNKGMFRLTQAIYKPESELKSGEKYTLFVDSLNERERNNFMKYNSETNKLEPIIWNIVKSFETDLPKFKSLPTHKKSQTIRYGCGPAIYAHFELNISGDKRLLVKTELKQKNRSFSNTYILELNESRALKVGHGMCSGAFDYKSGKKYLIRFQLYDQEGKSDNTWTDWIEFESPYEEYSK